ncbi:hypothetical protein B0H19DRAFT_1365113 [Mycena capillaripes]|nr:hypothetical protein B0H19DRAFT_1365113 [Mycena capillaripes]
MVRILPVLCIAAACVMAAPAKRYQSGSMLGIQSRSQSSNQSSKQFSNQSSNQNASQNGIQNGSSPACNAALLKTIFDVTSTETLLAQIASKLNSTDLATVSAAVVAGVGIISMDKAIIDILNAINSGQAAPSASLNQIDDAVNTVSDALKFITDPNVNATVVAAQDIVSRIPNDGTSVGDECK